MLSHLRNQSRVLIFPLLIFLSIQSSFTFGADTAALPGSTAPQNPLAVNAATASDSGGTLTPAQPAQQADRKNGAGAAQAAAIAGAAMAGMSCIMLMNEARKMPPGSEKNMTMMMAMQQCAQSAQSAASAGKNGDAKAAVSQNDIPKQAQLTAPKTPVSASTSADPTIPQLPEQSPEPIPNVEDLIPTEAVSDPTSIPPPASLEDGKPMDNFAVKNESISALKPLENAKVDFNENAKEGDKAIDPNALGGGLGSFTNFAGIKGISAEELKKAVAELSGEGGKKKKGAGGTLDEGASGAEGSSAAKEEGGNSAFDQMLAQLMGGSPQAEPMAGMGGLDVVVLPKEPNAPAGGPNIFQYASYRYRTATFNDGRIKTKRQASRPLIPSQAVAVSKP